FISLIPRLFPKTSPLKSCKDTLFSSEKHRIRIGIGIGVGFKAENLYIDEVKGVEILLHESEVGDYFQQLKNLHIQNGAMIQYIFEDNDDVHQIEFQVLSLTLQGLPNLISFCSQNKGSISTSPQGTTLL
ncbi:hypothetical protein Gotri_019813, partial [Gossypium trilobum]|nr:hypothetical protein [Gossypium trilobum]